MAWVNGRRTVRCRHCFLAGHNRRNCPTLSPEAKAQYATGDRARKCSYCGEAGHTRPKCGQMKDDKLAYTVRNAEYRREILERMVSMGLGIGSLVYNGDPKDIAAIKPSELYMIDRIDWDEAQNKHQSAYIFHGTNLAPDGYSNTFMMPPPENVRAWHRLNVLTRRPEVDIRSAIPSGWLGGSSGIDRFFNKKRRY